MGVFWNPVAVNNKDTKIKSPASDVNGGKPDKTADFQWGKDKPSWEMAVATGGFNTIG